MIYWTPKELEQMQEFDKSITLDGRDKKEKPNRTLSQIRKLERQRVYEAEKRKKKKEAEQVFRYKNFVRGVTT
jgi:hypothetical protein